MDGYGCQNYGETTEYNSCVPIESNGTDNLINTGSSPIFSIAIGVILIAVSIYMIYRVKKGSKTFSIRHKQ